MKRATIARRLSLRDGAQAARPMYMLIPVDITFRDMKPSLALEATIDDWADRLARLEPRIVRAVVVISRPHRKQRNGQMFHVRLEIAIPDREIIVDRASMNDAHSDAYVAVGDAFRAARRQLHDAIEIRRGDVKVHA